MRTSPILALVSVLALAACGDEGPPSDAEHYAAATREVAAAWCGAVARCCDAAELAPIAAEFGFTSPEQCAGTFVAKAAAVEERLRAGQVQLDREAMAACQRELAAATCGQFAAIEATCARAVRGAIANGDACDDDGVCASGWCGEASEDSPRTCKGRPGRRRAVRHAVRRGRGVPADRRRRSGVRGHPRRRRGLPGRWPVLRRTVRRGDPGRRDRGRVRFGPGLRRRLSPGRRRRRIEQVGGGSWSRRPPSRPFLTEGSVP
jgi:hypothetical protein